MSQHSDDGRDETHPSSEPSPRRSGRRRLPTSRVSGEAVSGSAITTVDDPSKKVAKPDARRNPKRKASEASTKSTVLPADTLLEEALRPLDAKEIEDWEGWIELESEPAFFNIILKDLGVSNVKAQEIFTMDQASLDILPKPVFGLIFLYQYTPMDDETERMEDTDEIWFANQTINNACATVALLNIVMNAPEVQLGDRLTQFKKDTKDLSTALKGHCLGSNKFIRSVHNSFTRRMDHLNADLCLENNVADAGTKRVKTTASKKGKKQGRKKTTVSDEYGFHFVAYVSAGSHVWELDGLKRRPLKIGSVDSEDWTAVVRPLIEARMLQYEEDQLSFNLIALCESPLASVSKEVARGVASLRHLHEAMCDQPEFERLLTTEDRTYYSPRASELSGFNITQQDVADAEIPVSTRREVSQAKSTVNDAYCLHQKLLVECKASMGEYRGELTAMADDEQRVKGRRKDYCLALHKWVSKLAEKGILEELIRAAK